MKSGERFMLCTVEKLGELIANEIENDVFAAGKQFIDCDFAIVDGSEGEDPSMIAKEANAWYGIKAVDAGFDSDRIMLVADYYGGGGASMCTVGESDIDVAEVISDTILEPLQCAESATKETVLVVEFLF